VIVAGLGWTFVALAVANWWAVSRPAPRRRRRLVAFTKVGATAALAGVATVAGDLPAGARIALVLAVVACLAGDALLLGASELHFLAGLGSFAVGHALYVVTALLVGVTPSRALVAVPFLVALLGFRFAVETVPGAARQGGPLLGGAVVVYAVVIAAMVLTVTATGSWAAAAGAASFAVSDWLIGYDRFVRPLPHARLAVMVTYHVGQALLVGGLVYVA
jgi:uncharacterized membrane protein YhhN